MNRSPEESVLASGAPPDRGWSCKCQRRSQNQIGRPPSMAIGDSASPYALASGPGQPGDESVLPPLCGIARGRVSLLCSPVTPKDMLQTADVLVGVGVGVVWSPPQPRSTRLNEKLGSGSATGTRREPGRWRGKSRVSGEFSEIPASGTWPHAVEMPIRLSVPCEGVTRLINPKAHASAPPTGARQSATHVRRYKVPAPQTERRFAACVHETKQDA